MAVQTTLPGLSQALSRVFRWSTCPACVTQTLSDREAVRFGHSGEVTRFPGRQAELLAWLAQAGISLPGAGAAFCEYTDSQPKIPHWFALDPNRTLFAFAGI
jgi:hypothetical protein